MDITILEKNRLRYHKRREYYNRNRKAQDKNRRDKRREFLNSFKNKPCMDCGVRYPVRCMDFHHRNGDGKGFRFMTRKLEEVEAEIKKCDVVCANCHRLRH